MIERWALKWHLHADWIAAFATLVRTRWRHRPEQPLDEVLETLHGFPIRRWSAALLRASVDRLHAYPTMPPADPRNETEADFVARAKAHYKECTQYVGLFSVPVRNQDVSQYCEWLIRVQVLGTSPSTIANSLGLSRQAIDRAVRHHARAIGMRLTKPGPGRRRGVVEGRPRRRVRR